MDYLLFNDPVPAMYAFTEGGINPGDPNFSSASQKDNFLGGNTYTIDNAQNKAVQDKLALLQNRVPVGGDYLMGTFRDRRYVVDGKGDVMVEVAQMETVPIGNQDVRVATVRGRSDFSGATLADTNMLFIGDKVTDAMKRPQLEVQQGYKPGESVELVVGHELVHVKFHTLPLAERQSIVNYYAAQRGKIHDFAQLLMTRPDYRKAVLKQTQKLKGNNPDTTKTLQVQVEGERHEVAVETVVDELLAYNSTNTLIGQDRVGELARINPMREPVVSREMLSKKAGETMKEIKSVSPGRIPGETLYDNLQAQSGQVITSVSRMIRAA